MFKMRLRCRTHDSEVISAEGTRSNVVEELAPFVFIRDMNGNWVLDIANLYCTGGVGEHEFDSTIYDMNGNRLK